MDTRFWGPSGWKLLHRIATSSVAHPKQTLRWFELLPYVLPCKYCRASLHDYYIKQPLTIHIVQNPSEFSLWIYDIHNMVNDKLRSQGLLKTPNPTYREVHMMYQKLSCNSPMIGWDFLASIAYTTPTRGVASKPMSDIPDHTLTFAEQNRYNVLSKKARIAALKEWWSLIPSILPCSSWRSAWYQAVSLRNPVGSQAVSLRNPVGSQAVSLRNPVGYQAVSLRNPVGSHQKGPPLKAGREAVSCWLWDIESSVCSCLKCPTAHRSLPDLKSDLSAFESSCGTKKKRRTCRAKRAEKRQAALTRRIQRGGAIIHY